MVRCLVNQSVTSYSLRYLFTDSIQVKGLLDKANSHLASLYNSPPFMKPKGSVLCSQEPNTGRQRCIQSMPSPFISLRAILILPSHLCLCLPSCLFPSGILLKILYAFLISPTRTTCPANLITYLINPIILGEACKL